MAFPYSILKYMESYVRIVIDYRNLLESSDKDAF